MRTVCLMLIVATSTGCRFSWEADVDTDCAEFRTWYRDADGDRWGVVGDSQDACGPSGEYTARNDRDCDDADPAITGRIGSICPDRLVTNGAAPDTDATAVTGVVVGTNEVVVVHGPTSPTYARAAEDACGESGWGGGLFALSESSQIVAALDAVPDEATIWAGYVGIVFNPDAPFPAGSPAEDQPPAGQWEFIGGGAVPETRLCSFDGAFGADARDYDPALGFLALVKDKPPLEANGSSSDFCFGTPDEAIPLDGCTGAGRTCYEERFGHFMCARPEAAPGPYAL